MGSHGPAKGWRHGVHSAYVVTAAVSLGCGDGRPPPPRSLSSSVDGGAVLPAVDMREKDPDFMFMRSPPSDTSEPSEREPLMDPDLQCLSPIECETDADCPSGATCTQCQCVSMVVEETGCTEASECSTDAECADYQTCDRCTCVGEGLLRFTLAWDSDTDFDLHVITPSGEEILWFDPQEMDGRGELDVDDISGGPGSVENVYFWDPLPGRYQYFARHFDPFRDPGTIELTTYRDGQQLDRHTQTLGSYEDTPLYSLTY